MLRVTIMLILGIIIGRAVGTSVPVILWIASLLVSVVVALLLRRNPVGQSIALLLSFFFLGSILISRSLSRMNIKLPTDNVDYQAVLLTEPSVHGKVVQTDLLVLAGDRTVKVRASILRDTVDNRWQRLHVGDGISASSVLEDPRNFYHSTFDYALWLKEHGFKAETFIYYSDWKKDVVDLTRLSNADRVVIQARKLRQSILSRYHDYGADGQNYAVLAAMTLGDKSALSRELKDDYSISGASHVLALSGLHLGIIYGILTLLSLSFRRRWLSQLIIMSAVWAYVVLVGMPASVVRSAVMLSVIALVTILNRNNILLNSLSLAAFVILVMNPLSLYDIGFQMSFMAVLGIALFLPMLCRQRLFMARWKKWLYKLWGMIAVSLAAQLGTAPLVAYYFGRFSCYFILTNLVVIPFAVVVLYGTIAVVVTFFSPTVSTFLAGILIGIVQEMNKILHWIASLPGASVDGISWSKTQVIAIYASLLALYFILNFFAPKKYPH